MYQHPSSSSPLPASLVPVALPEADSEAHQAVATHGVFGATGRFLFGAQGSRRLQESVGGAHFLSYLLICVQSISVVLILGHAQLMTLLTEPNLAARVTAGMILFVLLATVYAADMAVMRSFRRLGALKRNRQTGARVEHWLYILFVLGIETVTMAMVVAISDGHYQALLAPQPLIATGSLLWWVQIVLRSLMLAWSILQLFVVVDKLPPQLETLMSNGKEILGAQALDKMDEWGRHLGNVRLADLVEMYGIMDQRPVPYVGPLKGFFVNMKKRQHDATQEQRRLNDLVRVIQRAEGSGAAAAQPAASVRTTSSPNNGGTPAMLPAPQRASASDDLDSLDDERASSSPRHAAVVPMTAGRKRAASASASAAAVGEAATGRAERTNERSEAQLREARKALIEEWRIAQPDLSTAVMKARLEKRGLGPISKSTINGLIHEIEEHKRGLLMGTAAAASLPLAK